MSEKNILLAGDFASFAKLSKFENRNEMDLSIRSWLYNFKHTLTKTEEKLVHLLTQLAYKLKGVIPIKHQTLANTLGVSVKTIQRALATISHKEYGFLEVLETRTGIKQKTAKGKGNPKGRGHNVYIVKKIETLNFDEIEQKKSEKLTKKDRCESTVSNSVQSNVQSFVSSRKTPEKTVAPMDKHTISNTDTKSFDSKSSKDSLSNKTLVQRTVSQINQSDNSLLVPHWIPENFANVALKVFNLPDDVKKAFTSTRRIMLNKFKTLNLDYKKIEEYSYTVIRSYYQQVKDRNTNSTLEPITDPIAYITGIAKKLADTELDKHEEQERLERFELMAAITKPCEDVENSPENNQHTPNHIVFYKGWMEEGISL
ncbi:MAG: helix-turn-helix domain-containing protein [Carnobacterium alterfunditum]